LLYDFSGKGIKYKLPEGATFKSIAADVAKADVFENPEKLKRDITLVKIAEWKWKTQLSLERGHSESAAFAKETQSFYESELSKIDNELSNEN
jgi:hypothetical protein